MDTVGAYEAKTHFSELLERVADGQEVTITKHGVPVARLVPIDGVRPAGRKQAILELRRFRKGRRLGRGTVRRLIEEGRRF